MCGWLKDRFGVSWQITPAGLMEMLRANQPWGDYYGSLKDKFGVLGMVNYSSPKA